ncbi:MAG: C4-dicarboxylate TRAP transporter substrate-binding protein [Proteobacteria bacterium]|nr:C4-dicarboxylate TRAP transporter substrate-binding protein [Pseudomonadota bacterium]
MKITRRFALTVMTAVGACLGASATMAQTTLRIGTGQAAAELQNVILQEVADKVKSRTNGKLILQLFPGGQLGSERDVHEQVKMGAPILTVVDSGYFANYSTKDVGILSAPFVFKSFDEVTRLLNSSLAKEWLALGEKNNIKMLAFNWYFGERNIIGRKLYPKVADLSQVKFRLAPIPIYIDSFKALGVAPVTLDFAEVYSALQQGVVDAAEGPTGSLFASKLYEAAPNITLTGHVKQVLGIMMNKSVFDKLPADQQKILVEEMQAGGARYSKQGADRVADLRAQMEKAGTKFVQADIEGYKAAVLPMYSKYKDWSAGLYDRVRKIVAGQ